MDLNDLRNEIDQIDDELVALFVRRMAVSAQVASGEADCGMGVYSAAHAMGLDFIPVGEEEYDFAMRPETLEMPEMKSFLRLLVSEDFKAELERIAKEKEKAENGLRITLAKLNNEKFVANAPEAVVNMEREKAEKYRQMIAKLDESAQAMQG